MRIILINPPFEDEYSVGSSKSIKYVLNVIPPLGLAYLAAALEKGGFSVRIIDGFVEDINISEIISSQPDIIGLTATTPTFNSALSIAKRIRENLPSATIILGGAHITAMPFEAMRAGPFDIGVIGEGEEALVELVKAVGTEQCSVPTKTDLRSIKGLIYREGPNLVITPKREAIMNLDNIPFPARHLLPPLSRYRPTPASYRRLPLGVMITSRGCPQQCTFCDRAVFGNSYRFRSPENVLGEVDELIAKYGAKEIRFFDDCFALNRERAYQICAGLRKRKAKIPWTCLTTVGSVTKELLKEIKESGCWQVLYGLESGSDRMLKLLKKGASLDQNIQAVKWAKEAGLSVRADFIVGTPGETEESLKETLDFALKMKLDYAHFNKFVPYPGTALYEQLVKEGHSFDFGRGSSITDNESLQYIPDTLADKDFYRNFINLAHKKFYLRLSYIARRLFSIKTWDEFKGQMLGFFAILFLKNRKSYA